jgi:hypothetical protein
VTMATLPANGFFSREFPLDLLIRAMRILPRTGHSFCATLILSLEFSAALEGSGWPWGNEDRRRVLVEGISSGHKVNER